MVCLGNEQRSFLSFLRLLPSTAFLTLVDCDDYFIDYAKAFDCVDHNKLWKILQEMGIPDLLACLLRNLYSGQEARVRTRHETTPGKDYDKAVHCHLAYLTSLNAVATTVK